MATQADTFVLDKVDPVTAPPVAPVRFSASATELALHCSLPFNGFVTRRERDVGGRPWGSAAHEVLEVVRSGKRVDPSAIIGKYQLHEGFSDRIPSLVKAIERITEAFRSLPDVPGMALSEVAFAYDPEARTSDVIGYNLDRGYREAARSRGWSDELVNRLWFGSADLVWMATDGSGRVVVVDLKTGWDGRTVSHMPQLLTLALFAMRAYNATGAMVGTIPLRDEEAEPMKLKAVEDYDLLAHEDLLHERLSQGPLAQATPGSWCTDLFCDAIDDCPMAGRVKELALIPASHLTVKLKGPIATVEEARARLELHDAVAAWLKQNDHDLKVWADAHDGIQAKEGRWGKQEPRPRLERIEVNDDAMRTLKDKLGDDRAMALIRITTTKGAIHDAVKAAGLPVKATVDGLMARLADVKACVYSHPEKYDYDKGGK